MGTYRKNNQKNTVMEEKITIPEGYTLKKVSDTEYRLIKIIRPRPSSWEEFCRNYPVKSEETFIYVDSSLKSSRGRSKERLASADRNLCTSKEEAGAFLALIQLRQLRKAWVGDWEQISGNIGVIFYSATERSLNVTSGCYWANKMLSFPTREMASEFYECFKDLCETARILL